MGSPLITPPCAAALTAAATTMDSSSVLLLQLGLIGFGSVGAVVGGRAALAGKSSPITMEGHSVLAVLQKR